MILHRYEKITLTEEESLAWETLYEAIDSTRIDADDESLAIACDNVMRALDELSSFLEER